MSLDHNRACREILVVEDDVDIADILTVVLLRMGTTRSPCLILLDFMMPGMNGIEFRREQLQDPALASVPVVLITADPRLDCSATK